MNAKIFLIVLLLLAPYFLSGTGGDVEMVLPVRVFDGKAAVTGLDTKHFRLTVNGAPRELTGVEGLNVSLSKRPDFLGRHFVLCFHILEYGRGLQDAVADFVTDILGTRDTLTLMSPLKVYSIKGSANKEGIIENIRQWLERDCAVYKKNFTALEKELDNALKRVKQVAGRGGRVDDNYLVQSYKDIGMFLNSFPRGFKNFREAFLLPGVTRFKGVIKLLGNKEGERWWIGFQQGEIFDIIGGIREALVHINDYMDLNGLARTAFAANVNDLEKLLRIPENFPSQSLKELFQLGRTRFNVLVMSRVQGKNAARTGLLNGVTGVFVPIARETGGLALLATDLDKAMKRLTGHRDYFYNLSYPAGKEKQDHSLNLTVSRPPGETLKAAYPPLLDKEYVSACLDYYGGKRITVSNSRFKNGKLSFTVHSFMLADGGQGEPFALVKVRIRLLNEKGEQLFRTEKTLRSQNHQINITLPLPVNKKGKNQYRLSITACDLMANRLSRIDSELK